MLGAAAESRNVGFQLKNQGPRGSSMLSGGALRLENFRLATCVRCGSFVMKMRYLEIGQ
jgi:hypothetical protein